MIKLYDFNISEDLIETQYGEITYLQWLNKEKERIERGSGRMAEVVIHGVSSSLFVNPPKDCNCDECRRIRG